MHIPSFRRMPESSNRVKINIWMTRYARPVGRPPGVQRAVRFCPGPRSAIAPALPYRLHRCRRDLRPE